MRLRRRCTRPRTNRFREEGAHRFHFPSLPASRAAFASFGESAGSPLIAWSKGSASRLLAAQNTLDLTVAFVDQDGQITTAAEDVVTRSLMYPPNAAGRRRFLCDGDEGTTQVHPFASCGFVGGGDRVRHGH